MEPWKAILEFELEFLDREDGLEVFVVVRLGLRLSKICGSKRTERFPDGYLSVCVWMRLVQRKIKNHFPEDTQNSGRQLRGRTSQKCIREFETMDS